MHSALVRYRECEYGIRDKDAEEQVPPRDTEWNMSVQGRISRRQKRRDHVQGRRYFLVAKADRDSWLMKSSKKAEKLANSIWSMHWSSWGCSRPHGRRPRQKLVIWSQRSSVLSIISWWMRMWSSQIDTNTLRKLRRRSQEHLPRHLHPRLLPPRNPL